MIELKRKDISHIEILDGKYVSIASDGKESVLMSPSKRHSIPAVKPSSQTIPKPAAKVAQLPAFSFNTDAHPFKPGNNPFGASKQNGKGKIHSIPPPRTSLNVNATNVTHVKTSVSGNPAIHPTQFAFKTISAAEKQDETIPGPVIFPAMELSLVEKFEQVKDFVFNSLIDSIVANILHEVFDETQKSQDNMKLLVSKELFSELLNAIIEDLARERLNTSARLKNYQENLSDVANELISASVTMLLKETIEPLLQEEFRIKQYERFGWDRWRYAMLLKSYQREKEELMGKRMVSYLRQSALVAAPQALNIEPIRSENMMIERRLTAVALEMAEQRATWYTPVKLEEQVLPFLDSSPLSRYKIILALCSPSEKVSGTLSWFADTWFRSKLAKNPITEANLLDEVFVHDREKTRVLIQQCDAYQIPMLTSPPHNSQSSFSGTNAAIFQCDYYTPIQYKSKAEYFNRLFVSLQKFASNFALHSSIPLMLVYWPNFEIPELEFREVFSPFLSDLTNFSKFDILTLKVSTELFDSEQASSSLIEHLIYLFESASPEPKLETDIVSSFANATKKFEWSVHKIENELKLISSEYMKKPILISHAFQVLIQIYNSLLSQITEVLIDEALESIPFPAVEFATFSLDWNVIESFSYLNQISTQSRLPDFPPNTISESK